MKKSTEKKECKHNWINTKWYHETHACSKCGTSWRTVFHSPLPKVPEKIEIEVIGDGIIKDLTAENYVKFLQGLPLKDLKVTISIDKKQFLKSINYLESWR